MGLIPHHFANISFSIAPRNKQAKVGATRDPMAHPTSCRKNFLSKVSTLHDSTKVNSVIKNIVGMVLSVLESRKLLKILIPSWIGIFVYNDATSSVTGIVLVGWGPLSFMS